LYQQLVDMPSPGAKGYGRGGLMYLYLLQGKISRAIEQARQGFDLVNKPGNPRQKLSWLSRSLYLYHTTGNLNESLNEYENMWKLALESPDLEIQLIALWAKGLDYLKMNSMDKAQETAAELEKRCFDSLNRNLMRYCEHLSGLIEIERGDYLKAVEHLERALFLANSQAFSRSMSLQHPWHACIRDALASAQLKAGNWERARQEYAEITRLSVGRLDAGDIYVKAFYNLGKIYEEQGDRAKAAENYAKFLDLWKDADPGIVEVEDAKKRMAKF
jgi:tetratricopeptide (TPR) repeat protein